jgi:peptide/nickel transport system permease protein
MTFIIRRIWHSVLLLLGVSLLAFLLLQMAPGSFFDEMRLNPQVSPQTIAKLSTQYGMERPLPVRYFAWLKSVFRGDWGLSLAYNAPVAPLVMSRAKNTLLLTTTATLLSWGLALPVGILSAAAARDRRSRWIDHFSSLTTTLLLVTPDLLLALSMLWIAVRTHWWYVGGMLTPGLEQQSPWLQLKDVTFHLIGPVAVLVLGSLPILVRHIRSAVAEVLDLPFIQAARGHGLKSGRILCRHALPAAAAPLVSLFGLSVGTMLSASLLVEVVMNWPGIGPVLLEAILARDVYVVIASVMFSATLLVAGMFLADCLLFLADPRIRTEGLV